MSFIIWGFAIYGGICFAAMVIGAVQGLFDFVRIKRLKSRRR